MAFPYPLACNEYREEGPGQPIVCVNTAGTLQCPEGTQQDSQNPEKCRNGDTLVSKVCPMGTIWSAATGNRCIKLTPPTCPAGSTVYEVYSKTGGRTGAPLCIPSSTPLTERPLSEAGRGWPCGDVNWLGVRGTSFVCIPPAASSSATPAPDASSSAAPAPSTSMSSAPTSTPAPVTPPVDVQTTLEDVNQSLKPFRPPTAPASDKAIERKAILSGNQSLVFIQLVLFILLAVLVAYLLLPTNYANGIAFVLLCVGVAYGFFLRK